MGFGQMSALKSNTGVAVGAALEAYAIGLVVFLMIQPVGLLLPQG
jgi:hypothetical protein